MNVNKEVNSMRFFIDTANVDEIREANDMGIIAGVTTNPSLIAKEGRDYMETLKEITEIVDGPISGEVKASTTDAEGMIAEVREIAKIHKNMVVKIPMTTEGLKAVKVLSAEGIHTNVTLVFSASQALLAARAGATYVSPFLGRLDDISTDGIALIQDIEDIFQMNPDIETEVICASVRHPMHVVECAKTGADIATVCNEAALNAARHNNKTVGKQDFLNAVDRIIGGLEKKTKVMTNDEKRTIALHEAGHATVSWFCEHANPLVKVSIVPRGRALGAAWYLPEERQITTKEQMLDEMCSLLGGRAAEELFTGHISTGAMNDLERATKSAFGMVAYAGMSDRLPNICYYNNDEYQFQRPYSETTAKTIDDEVLKIINDEYARAKAILKEHSEGHNELAELLSKREVSFAEDVERIFGKRPWVSRSEEIIEDNTPKLEDMPEEVRQAQAEHEASVKDNSNTESDNKDDETNQNA